MIDGSWYTVNENNVWHVVKEFYDDWGKAGVYYEAKTDPYPK